MNLDAKGPMKRFSRGEDVHEVLVNSASHPYLDSHRVHNKVVLPVVLVHEWFARAAKRYRPDLILTTCREFGVLKGVLLEDFETNGERFTIHTSVLSEDHENAKLQLDLHRPDGTLHYRANMEMSRRPHLKPDDRDSAPLTLGPIPWDSPYNGGDLLDYGPAFQVIKSVEGLSLEGTAGIVAKTSDMNWSDGQWQTDPALMEGGLQLARIWAFQSLGDSLPTGIQSIRYYQSSLDNCPHHCTVRGEVVSDKHGLVDFTLVDAKGAPVFEASQVEFHSIPKSKATAE